jgi:2-desacetyl-2-hydroxyethyl bacteriochlorophyllide A dehydrogenase
MRIGPLPFTLGHEIAGEVVSVGPSVNTVRPGARVAVNALVDGPGTWTDGGYAPLVRVAAQHLVPIPDGVDFDQAAAATDAGRTAMHAVRVAGPLTASSRVGVIGLGGLGLLGAQIAVHQGAQVVAAEPRVAVHEAALRSGVRQVVRTVEDLAGLHLDVIIDFAGRGTTTDGAIGAVRDGGTVVQVGMGVRSAPIDLYRLTYKEVTLTGVLVGTNDDIAGVLRLVADGALSSVITPVRFDELPEAHERLRDGRAHGRMVIRFP